MSLNQVQLIGRLGAEPDTRAFPNGGSVCNLRIATSESWRDRETGERQERTEWHRVVLRNKLGETAQQYLKKGSQVFIQGRIQTRKWQDHSGTDRFTTEIVGNEMTMLDGRGGNSNSGNAPSQSQSQPDMPDYGDGPDYGDPGYDYAAN